MLWIVVLDRIQRRIIEIKISDVYCSTGTIKKRLVFCSIAPNSYCFEIMRPRWYLSNFALSISTIIFEPPIWFSPSDTHCARSYIYLYYIFILSICLSNKKLILNCKQYLTTNIYPINSCGTSVDNSVSRNTWRGDLSK